MLRLVCIFASPLLLVATFFGQEKAPSAQAAAAKPALDQLIPWLLDESAQLRGIPFSEVIVDVTGKKACVESLRCFIARCLYRPEAIVASSANQKD